jgi:hypothetical protein
MLEIAVVVFCLGQEAECVTPANSKTSFHLFFTLFLSNSLHFIGLVEY